MYYFWRPRVTLCLHALFIPGLRSRPSHQTVSTRLTAGLTIFLPGWDVPRESAGTYRVVSRCSSRQDSPGQQPGGCPVDRRNDSRANARDECFSCISGVSRADSRARYWGARGPARQRIARRQVGGNGA
ncbi:hypothetical protein BS50DRAFT_355564 [Corynespora cassiicola Philippines]|uniref:Secreted protein n=1 Tax=Corynespora cassiicola Philippines TaxID=1448308 RepID=A0A2T2NRL3_CORCC|nr:hypothetical protein BS50DRAFT_355564 [Corynespora cassiicola Philippines]